MAHTAPDIDSAVISEWCKLSGTRLGERAYAVRLHLDGHSLPEIARRVGMPSRTARRWIERYQTDGPSALVDLRKSGRPLSLKRRRAAIREIVPELSATTRTRSPTHMTSSAARHLAWREARMRGLTSSRSPVKDIAVEAEAAYLAAGILGVLFLPGISLIALQRDKPWVRTFPKTGYWIRPISPIVHVFLDAGWDLADPIPLALAIKVANRIDTVSYKERPATEILGRWMSEFRYSDPPAARTLELLVIGDMASSWILQVLKLAQPPTRKSKRRDTVDLIVRLIPSADKLLTWLSRDSRYKLLLPLMTDLLPWPTICAGGSAPFAWIRSIDPLKILGHKLRSKQNVNAANTRGP